MHESNRGTFLVAGAIALVVFAVAFGFQSLFAPRLTDIPERPAIDLTACGYEDAQQATRNARQRQAEAPIRSDNTLTRERLAQNVQQAEAREEQAKACENSLRNGADLDAQWAAALSARNAAQISLSQWRWSAIEFSALALTLLAAGWAAWEARKAAHAARDALLLERSPVLMASIKGHFQKRGPTPDPVTQVAADGVPPPDWVFITNIKLRNAGRSPTTVFDVQQAIATNTEGLRILIPRLLKGPAHLIHGEWTNEIPFAFGSSEKVRRGVNEGGDAPLVRTAMRALYQGGDGELRVFGAAWEYRGTFVQFVPFGGSDFNFDKPFSEVSGNLFDWEGGVNDDALTELAERYKRERTTEERPDQ